MTILPPLLLLAGGALAGAPPLPEEIVARLTAVDPAQTAVGATWDADARARMPDALDVEIALEERGVPLFNASLVFSETRWRSLLDGTLVPEAAVGWQRMHGPFFLEPESTRGPARQEACGWLEGLDPVPGQREVVVRQPIGGEERVRATPPQVVLATGAEGELAIVSLVPGDSLMVVEATDRHSGERQERIVVAREGETLVLDRTGTATRACFSADRIRP